MSVKDKLSGSNTPAKNRNKTLKKNIPFMMHLEIVWNSFWFLNFLYHDSFSLRYQPQVLTLKSL